MIPSYAHLYRFLCLSPEQRETARVGLAATVAQWGDGWPKALGRYLAGEFSTDALLALAAQGTGTIAGTRGCEAHYVIGMTEFAAGRTEQAREHLARSVARELPRLSAFTFARAELEQLRAAQTP